MSCGVSYPSDASRIVRNIEKRANGCWDWTKSLNSRGYGRLNMFGAMVLAHRLSYESFVGPIPEGLQIDHLCRNRKCVNPAHLEPVTAKENIRRGHAARKALRAA